MVTQRTIELSAPRSRRPEDLYAAVREQLGGASIGKCVVKEGADGFRMEFTELMLDPDGYVRSCVAEGNQVATPKEIQDALAPYNVTVTIPPGLTDGQLAGIHWFCQNYRQTGGPIGAVTRYVANAVSGAASLEELRMPIGKNLKEDKDDLQNSIIQRWRAMDDELPTIRRKAYANAYLNLMSRKSYLAPDIFEITLQELRKLEMSELGADSSSEYIR